MWLKNNNENENSDQNYKLLFSEFHAPAIQRKMHNTIKWSAILVLLSTWIR